MAARVTSCLGTVLSLCLTCSEDGCPHHQLSRDLLARGHHKARAARRMGLREDAREGDEVEKHCAAHHKGHGGVPRVEGVQEVSDLEPIQPGIFQRNTTIEESSKTEMSNKTSKATSQAVKDQERWLLPHGKHAIALFVNKVIAVTVASCDCRRLERASCTLESSKYTEVKTSAGQIHGEATMDIARPRSHTLSWLHIMKRDLAPFFQSGNPRALTFR